MKTNKTKMILFLVAIFLTNLVTQHEGAIMPIAAALYNAFPENEMAVNFMISGPSIIFLFSSLLVPTLYKFFKRKTLLLAACIIFQIMAICAVITNGLWQMVTYRAIGGVCIGITQVVSVDIVASYFGDEKQRAWAMGLYNAAQAAIGVVFGIVAGQLAVSGWQNVYNVFWPNIIMILLVILFVPSQMDDEGNNANAQKATRTGKHMGSRFWISSVNFMIMSIIYAPLYMMAAVYVAENGLGNEAFAGLITSLGTVGSMTLCLLFGLLYKIFAEKTTVLSYILMAICLIVAFLFPNKVVFMIVSLLGGGAYGLELSYQYSHLPNVVPKENVTLAVSLITALNAFGMFLTTYVTTALQKVVSTVTAVSMIYGIVCLVCLVLEFINANRMKGYKPE